jgi:hypothetical protein
MNIVQKAFVFFAALIFLFLAGCTKGDNKTAMQNDKYAELRKLKIENAVQDALKSIESKDYRLLAVRGYALNVPGVSEDVRSIETSYGIKIIEGTSDAIEGPEHKRLNDNARAYAKIYNRTIVDKVKKKNSN